MSTQVDNEIRKTNKWSIASSIAGFLSTLPYSGWVVVFLASEILKGDLEYYTVTILVWLLVVVIPFFIHFVSGFVFGSISLIAGGIAIILIKNRRGVETGYRFAIIGSLLGVLGIVANILFDYYFIPGLLMRD